MADLLVSEMVNRSLPALLEAKEGKTTSAARVARELLGDEGSLLRVPVEQGLLSKAVRFLRTIFCTRSWCLYSDVKENLAYLLNSLQQSEVGYTVQDATHQYALRRACQGNAKEVISVALKAIDLGIKEMGLAESRKKQLHELVSQITKRVQGVEFREDFAEFTGISAQIDDEMAKLEQEAPNLAAIRRNLGAIDGNVKEQAVGEKLSYALARLEEKERVQKLKDTLSDVTSIEQLFLTASEQLRSYSPVRRYQSELKIYFMADVRATIKTKMKELVTDFEKNCKKAIAHSQDFGQLQKELEERIQDVILPDYINIPEPLQGIYKVDSGGVILKAYLKVFKKQFRQDIEKMKNAVQGEEDLVKLGSYKQHVHGLYMLLDCFEQVAEEEVIYAIKEKVDDLNQIIDAQLQLQAKETKVAVEPISEPVVVGERKIVPLKNLSAYGVALGALGWVPKVGLPLTSILEAVTGKSIKREESAVGTMISLAAIASYVALANKGSSLLWGMAPIVAPTLAGHMAGSIPIVNLIPPLRIAAGIALAGITHQVMDRGLWVFWDVVSYGLPQLVKFTWQGVRG